MFETEALTWLGAGIVLMLLAGGLRRLEGGPIPFPGLVVLAGAAYFSVPGVADVPDLMEDTRLVLHITELTVIVSLFGVGLKIDRKLSWRTWSVPIRLLVICMPLCILAVAMLGHHLLGMSIASAVLLGAVLAPTDPVLASDVQVGEPLDAQGEEEDEVRFGLTAEAGLNDSLAFPFTYLAIHMATGGTDPATWWFDWVVVDLGRRLVVGSVVGVVVGWVLARLLLSLDTDTERDRTITGIGALAATGILYGMAELLGGYGFLAVFLGALTVRRREMSHDSHRSLHVVAEQTEQIALAVVLFGLGGALTAGVLDPLGWRHVVAVVAIIFVIRPLLGWVSLVGSSRLPGRRRSVTGFFGVRGVGSVFYLAYAFDAASFDAQSELTAVVAAVIVVSIVVHGVTAPLVIARYP